MRSKTNILAVVTSIALMSVTSGCFNTRRHITHDYRQGRNMSKEEAVKIVNQYTPPLNFNGAKLNVTEEAYVGPEYAQQVTSADAIGVAFGKRLWHVDSITRNEPHYDNDPMSITIHAVGHWRLDGVGVIEAWVRGHYYPRLSTLEYADVTKIVLKTHWL